MRVAEHEARCSCKMLVQAVGLDPRSLSFDYRYRLLQKRWRMTCTHGEPASAIAATGGGERWRYLGQIDPVRAILMSNNRLNE